jgi:hypothetical protein
LLFAAICRPETAIGCGRAHRGAPPSASRLVRMLPVVIVIVPSWAPIGMG